ncbi:MAG: hypothetical protein JRH15_14390 [Deltaproteobacteria bacterium]|nr:hypothetical protein [Deltaproteobacteria bacterium]
MALDEPRDTDEVFDIGGYTYLVEKTVLEQAKPITVDFAITCFKLDCSLDFSGAASACSACSTSGDCG